MAGERIGKAYEAILKVALDQLKKENFIHEEIFWNSVVVVEHN